MKKILKTAALALAFVPAFLIAQVAEACDLNATITAQIQAQTYDKEAEVTDLFQISYQEASGWRPKTRDAQD